MYNSLDLELSTSVKRTIANLHTDNVVLKAHMQLQKLMEDLSVGCLL